MTSMNNVERQGIERGRWWKGYNERSYQQHEHLETGMAREVWFILWDRELKTADTQKSLGKNADSGF